jgi:hypothetical protein
VSTGYLIDGVAPGGGGGIYSSFGIATEHESNPTYTYARAQQAFYDGTYIWIGGIDRRCLLSTPLSVEVITVDYLLGGRPGNFPASNQSWCQVGNRIYFYGGRAASTDDTYANGSPIDRIWSAPTNDLTDLTEEANVLPEVAAFGVACRTGTYVYIVRPGNSNLLRAPLNDPTNFTNLGPVQVGGTSTNQVSAYQVGTTVYAFAGGGTNRTIYSSSDMETWTSTGSTFPGYASHDEVLRCGDFFYYHPGTGGVLTDDLYFATIANPTKWVLLAAVFPVNSAESCPVLLPDGAYWYWGYVGAVGTNKCWRFNQGQVGQGTTPAWAKYGSSRDLFDY